MLLYREKCARCLTPNKAIETKTKTGVSVSPLSTAAASSLVEHASLVVKPLPGSCHAARGLQMTLTGAVRVVAGSEMNF